MPCAHTFKDTLQLSNSPTQLFPNVLQFIEKPIWIMHSVKLVIDLQTAIIIMYALVMHPSIVVLTEGITTATFNWRASNNTKHHCSSIHTNRWKQAMYYLTTCQFQDLSRDWPFPWYMIQNIDSQYCLHKTASHSIQHSSLPCSCYGALRLSFDTSVIWPPATSLASWNK